MLVRPVGVLLSVEDGDRDAAVGRLLPESRLVLVALEAHFSQGTGVAVRDLPEEHLVLLNCAILRSVTLSPPEVRISSTAVSTMSWSASMAPPGARPAAMRESCSRELLEASRRGGARVHRLLKSTRRPTPRQLRTKYDSAIHELNETLANDHAHRAGGAIHARLISSKI